MNLKHFNSESEYIQQALHTVSESCSKNHGTISIALSGGSTPLPLYAALAQDYSIPFDRIELFQVDERYIPKDHPDSNRKMIEETVVSKVNRLKGWNFFDTSLPLEEALKSYEEILNKKIDHGFDLVILGIGQDGHIASLFPNSPALHEQKIVSHTQTDDFVIKDRLTITLALIMNSKHLIILFKGKEKASVLDELQNGTKSAEEFPAKYLLSHQNLDIFFLEA